MCFGKILREPLLKLIHMHILTGFLEFIKKLTYTKAYLMWFSQLLQEKDDIALQNIFTEDETLQMLQETGFRANPYRITQAMKSTVLR